MITPSIESLRRAIQVAEQIEKLQAELAAMFGGEAPKAAVGKAGRRRGRPAKADKPAKEKKPKRQMSEEARARIVAAQKKRWAKIKKEKKAEVKAEQAKAGE
jgi:hypothetical protein